MLSNAFIDKTKKPTDDELTAALGPAKAIWDQLLAELADEYNIVDQEWNSYSHKAGWSLRLKHRKRNLVYIIPCQGCFFVSFALGDKAVQAARQSELPKRVIKIINESKRYAEGTGVRFEVKGPKDIDIVKKLTAIKMDN
ncbi:MAG: DUF3788 domain-containing protein [Thermoguttaceae bacterium]|jgi:hypothetical protein